MAKVLDSPKTSRPVGYRLVETQRWDVVAPVPDKTLKAAITPKAFRFHHRLRRIVLETYHIAAQDSKFDSFEQTVVKFLVPMRRFSSSSNASRSSGISSNLSHVTFVRPNRNSPINQKSSFGISFDPNESSSVVSELGTNDDDDGADGSTNANVGWKAKYMFDIDDFIILSHKQNTCIVTTTFSEKGQRRELIFNSEQSASEFISHIKMRNMLEKSMKDNRLLNMIGKQHINDLNERIEFLLDIVGAQGLQRLDTGCCSPYVVVKLGERFIHQTDYLENSLNPIWTIRTKSIFLLSVTVKELLLLNEKLEVHLFDFRDSHKVLGMANVPTADIFLSKGDRKEYLLNDSPNRGLNQGRIAIRCRRATEYDREILNKVYSEPLNHGSLSVLHGPVNDKVDGAIDQGNLNLTSIVEKTERTITQNGVKIVQYKSRPGPNVTDKMDTEWLTNDEIQKLIYKPSLMWKDLGKGTLGTAFLEVLGCDSLPRREKIGIFGTRRDTFIQLVYGGSCSNTDVIDTCLSPRWLPWSVRAFSLHLMNQQTVIFLGVFDRDVNQCHTFLGRVAIPLVMFHPNTEYLLDYNIHRNSSTVQKSSLGVLKIRLRLQIDHPRQYLISAIRYAEPLSLNLPDKRQFQCAFLTCFGESDYHESSVNGLSQLLDECWTNISGLSLFYEDICEVFFWRKPRSSNSNTVLSTLPLRSMIIFLSGLIVLKYPRFSPSSLSGTFLLFLVAMVRQNFLLVSPWKCCSNISELSTLLLNKNLSSVTITPGSDCTAVAEDSADLTLSDSKWTPAKPLLTEALDEINSSQGLKKSHTLSPNISSLQTNLLATMEWVRIVKRVLIGEETLLCFWVHLFLALITIVFLFLPWLPFLKIAFTVWVWLILSPLMKVIDVFFVQTAEPSDIQRQPIWIQSFRSALNKYLRRLRIKREEEKKLKDMKESILGRFSVRIPRFSIDRFTDIPLASSSATPHHATPLSLADLCVRETGLDKIREYGQNLVGSIIPQIEKTFEFIVPLGQIARKKYLLDIHDPAASLTSDSRVLAALQLFVIAFFALVTTWFAVPTLKLATELSSGIIYGLFMGHG